MHTLETSSPLGSLSSTPACTRPSAMLETNPTPHRILGQYTASPAHPNPQTQFNPVHFVSFTCPSTSTGTSLSPPKRNHNLNPHPNETTKQDSIRHSIGSHPYLYEYSYKYPTTLPLPIPFLSNQYPPPSEYPPSLHTAPLPTAAKNITQTRQNKISQRWRQLRYDTLVNYPIYYIL